MPAPAHHDTHKPQVLAWRPSFRYSLLADLQGGILKIQKCLYGVAGLLLASSTIHAAVINVSLGQSGQNWVMTGLGANGSNDGTYSIQQGSCGSSAGLTTCTLSGSILAAGSSAGYNSGTYSFVTTYATADVLPVQGQSQTPNSNLFYYDYLANDVTMVLNLNTGSGNFSETMSTAGGFPAGVGFGFTYVGTEVCTIVATCSQANVGYVNGATISGPVTISASFTIPDATNAPEPQSLALMGITSLAAAGLWLRSKRTV